MLLLPLAPILVRPALLELVDCLLSPSEEPGREGIIASALNFDAYRIEVIVDSCLRVAYQNADMMRYHVTVLEGKC